MQGQTLKERRSSRKKAPSPSPVCLYQRRRHLEIWRCQNENSAFAVLSWRHSRDVPSGFAPLPRRAAECWKKDASFFNVISAASLWDLRLWCQWGEGMWGCVRIESTCVNVFSHCTYYNALFIVFFLRCLRQMKVQRRIVQSRRHLTALLDDRARLGEDWRRGSVIWKWVKPCVYRVQPLCTGAV